MLGLFGRKARTYERDSGEVVTNERRVDGKVARAAAFVALWVPAYIAVMVTILGVVVAIIVIDQHTTDVKRVQDNANNAELIRQSQYVGCVKSGNTFRRQVRHEFASLKEHAIIPIVVSERTLWRQALAGARAPKNDQQREAIELFKGFVVKLTNIIHQIRHRVETINERIPDVNCLHRYPPLPGQEYPPLSGLHVRVPR